MHSEPRSTGGSSSAGSSFFLPFPDFPDAFSPDFDSCLAFLASSFLCLFVRFCTRAPLPFFPPPPLLDGETDLSLRAALFAFSLSSLSFFAQHTLYFFLLPQGHGPLRFVFRWGFPLASFFSASSWPPRTPSLASPPSSSSTKKSAKSASLIAMRYSIVASTSPPLSARAWPMNLVFLQPVLSRRIRRVFLSLDSPSAPPLPFPLFAPPELSKAFISLAPSDGLSLRFLTLQ
mmetsp:Transcript_22039/g.44227  ORF Transcript_22039/g.44227 Transcript_22039/m.44227 type:complete len:232 (+) Transcript_22039:66-761(+)